MSNKLALVEAVASIGDAVMSMAASAKSLRSVRKEETVILAERIICLKNACRVHGCSELARICLNEMDKTFREIQIRKYSGPMLDMAMGILDIQYQKLCQSLQDYAMGK